MYNNYKSSTTAGLLGIFLGAVGAHDWYLGDRKKGTIHVCLFGAGVILNIIASLALPNILSFRTIYKILWLISLLSWAAWGLIGASEIWGFIDGIRILSAGDAGLARRGYIVNPNAGMNPNMNNTNNMSMSNQGNINSQNNMNGNIMNNIGAQSSINNQTNQSSNIDGINNPNNNQSN